MAKNNLQNTLSEINGLISTLLIGKFVRSYNSPIRIDSTAGTLIGWPSMKSVSPLEEIGPFASLSGYIDIISKNFYHIMLFDGSVLQMNYTYSGTEIVSHRLCYIPCPIILDIPPEEDLDIRSIVESSLISYLDHSTSSAASPAREADFHSRPPIRFDYDPRAAKHKHPASHVHIGWDNCRIAAKGPLSPSLFVKFILENFYDHKEQTQEMLNINGEVLLDTMDPLERGSLHFHLQQVT